MDVLSEEGHVPEVDISLANLVLDEKYENNGVRVILKLHGAPGTTTVTPADSVCYLDVEDDLESKAKQIIDSDSKTNIVLVSQAFLDIKFSLNFHPKNEEVRHRPLLCDLYYDCTSSNLIIRNRSDDPITIGLTSDSKAKAEYDSEQLFPQKTKYLSPGTYGIIIRKRRVLELRVLPRVDMLDTTRKLARPGIPSANGEKSFKRGLAASEGELNESPNTLVRQIRKLAHGMDNSSTLFLATNANDISSSPSGTGNPFVDLPQHGVLEIPGVLDVESYRIHKRKVLSTRAQSEVYLAQHSSIDKDIVVKVLKIQRSACSADNGRSLIECAEAWLREYHVQNGLKHESIVGLYGGDARFLTFYEEFAPGYDLTIKGVWRNTTDDYFRGSKDDAFQVSIDIASALEYLHDLGLEHNDIKPGNILLSKERGAILCDFGLSRRTVLSRATSGGTPWYIPPEYITVNQRGQPGDVFALGVTWLYLNKQLTLPDVAGKGFIIAHIHSRRTELQQAARNKMASWLAKVEAARAQLELSSTEAFIIRDMLSPGTAVRPTAAELVKRLKGELSRRNHRPQVKEKTGDHVAGGEKRGDSQKSTDHGSTTEENELIEWVPRSPRQ